MERLLPFYRSYQAHAAAWDDEFARVAARFADRMQCRKGCSACCSQMFGISPLEAAVISRAVKEMPDDDRAPLQEKARAYRDAARAQGLTTDDALTLAPRPGPRITCPALRNDACSIYAARPLICRKWGIPVFDPSKPDRLHACALNFREGEPIDATGLVAPQRTLVEAWAAIKDHVRDAAPHVARRTTIAEAILGDFDRLLREDVDADDDPAQGSGGV